MAYAHENYEISARTEAWHRSERDKIRDLCRDKGGTKERHALHMAEHGFGIDDIVAHAKVDLSLARKLVLGR